MTAVLPPRPGTEQTGWLLCGGCREMLYRKRFERSEQVCPQCGWHGPLTAPERLESLCDAGTAEVLEVAVTDTDPLRFTDTRPYAQRLHRVPDQRRGPGSRLRADSW